MGAKLDIGGGERRHEGFLVVDLCEGADVKHDLRKPLPFEEGEVEEILCVHVIESFYQWQFPEVLKDWYRVLGKGGKITIEFTSLSDSIEMYASGRDRQHGHWGLYGNQEKEVDPIVLHHFVYEKEELKELLEKTGFRVLGITTDGVEHLKIRDWRIIAEK